MVLEFVDAQPLGRMIERIDGRTRADGAKRADRRAGDEAVLVHAEIFSRDHVGPDLGILVEKERPADGGLDDASARIEAHDAMKVRRLVGCVLKTVDENLGVLHFRSAQDDESSCIVYHLIALQELFAIGRRSARPSGLVRSGARADRGRDESNRILADDHPGLRTWQSSTTSCTRRRRSPWATRPPLYWCWRTAGTSCSCWMIFRTSGIPITGGCSAAASIMARMRLRRCGGSCARSSTSTWRRPGLLSASRST